MYGNLKSSHVGFLNNKRTFNASIITLLF
jgi:hypothetical protein